jgi:hypothetical protein
VRILLVDILTFDGFFGTKFDILKPRWLPTQTAQASLDLTYARQPPNADWLFLVRFLKVTHALH